MTTCAAYPQCGKLVVKGYCDDCKKTSPKAIRDAARPSAAARGYGRRWQKASKAYLLKHPIAVDIFNTHGGRAREATVVDHIVAHRGDMKLFWDPGNWQPLTKEDHDRKTALEDGGFGRPQVTPR